MMEEPPDGTDGVRAESGSDRAPADGGAAPMTDEEFLRRMGRIERRRRRVWIVVIAAVLLLPVIAVISFGLYWKHALRAELEAIRAAGEPVTFEELLGAREFVPDEKNSALILRDALRLLTESEESRFFGMFFGAAPLGRLPSDDAKKIVDAWLTARSGALAKAHEAAAFPRGAWRLQRSDGNPFDMTLPHLSGLRELARACRLEALQRAAAGDGPGAVQGLVACRRIAASVDDEPMLISQLVRMAIAARTVDGIERALALTGLPPEALRELDAELAAQAARRFLKEALYAERASGLWVFTTPRRTLLRMAPGVFDLPQVPVMAYLYVPGWRQRDGVFYLGIMNRYVETADLPEREMLTQTRALDGEVQASLTRNRMAHPATLLLLPALGRAITGEVAARMRLRVARTALAVERYRLARGKWPESLEELVPEFLDAVAEDTLAPSGTVQYKRTEAGACVYSVGQDGADDGGTTQNEAAGGPNAYASTGFDIVFRLLEPERRGTPAVSFHEEIVETFGTELDWSECEQLKALGLTREEMTRHGFTDDHLLNWLAEDDEEDEDDAPSD